MKTNNDNTALFNKEDIKQYEKLAFALEKRNKPTVILISCHNKKLRDDICALLKSDHPEYKHFNVDAGNIQVESLYLLLKEKLPKKVLDSKKVSAIANVFDIENSLYTFDEGKLDFSPLLKTINFQRELLFRNLPIITIIWTDAEFFKYLQTKAQDFIDWITYIFEFKGNKKLEDFLPVVNREAIEKPGNIPEREERIRKLEKDLDDLPNDKGNERIKKERILLERLLGEEYLKKRDFDKAEYYLKKVLTHAKDIDDEEGITYALFLLGDLYRISRKWGKALENFQAIPYLENEFASYNLGAVYHQIGWVYEEQRKWNKALEKYHLAIEWYLKTERKHNLGAVYHQIGRVYEEQRKWNKALEKYHLAIEWKSKTSQELQLGSTYHHIGMVYQKQRKWKQGLKNYNEAIKWYLKTEEEYNLGGTYHQIGMVYQEQRKWDLALENYQNAIEWDTNTGQEFQLGSTYHQVGRVYEEQNKIEFALEYFSIAKENFLSHHLEHKLDTVNESINRVKNKIEQSKK